MGGPKASIDLYFSEIGQMMIATLELFVVDDLHIVSREKSVVSIRAQTLPPARVYLVNVRDDLPGVE